MVRAEVCRSADLRRPQIHRKLGVSNVMGLSDLFLVQRPLESLPHGVIQLHDPSRLTIITSGKLPPNPAELLTSQKMSHFLDLLNKQFDLIVIDTPPDVLSHNLETVPRLYRQVRPQAKYERSLELLQHCKTAGLRTKTGIMVGLGETREEVIRLMQDCVDHNVDVLTIGQYMQPTKMHHPVVEWVHPDQFAEYKEIGEALGLEHVESGPLVRSSYHAERHV